MILTRRAPSRQATMRRLDNLWARIVKTRAGWKCERCGHKAALNAAHIITRSRKGTRWLSSNGVCLDAGCHMFFHKNPGAFIDWVNQRAETRLKDGQQNIADYDALRILSQPGRTKIDLRMVDAQLKAQAREFGVRL